MKFRFEYLTSIISIVLLASYLLGYYSFYYTESSPMVGILILPSMLWFMACLVIGPVQLLTAGYNYYKKSSSYKHHVISGILVIISLLCYMFLLQQGFIITV